MLPQSILQSYVAVAFGRLEHGWLPADDGGAPAPGSPRRDWETVDQWPAVLLAASLCIAMVQAGAVLVSYEALVRPAVRPRSVVSTQAIACCVWSVDLL